MIFGYGDERRRDPVRACFAQQPAGVGRAQEHIRNENNIGPEIPEDTDGRVRAARDRDRGAKVSQDEPIDLALLVTTLDDDDL